MLTSEVEVGRQRGSKREWWIGYGIGWIKYGEEGEEDFTLRQIVCTANVR